MRKQRLSASTNMTAKGSFNNYVDRILPFFLTPSPLRGKFLHPDRGQKQTFFDPLPPHLVHVVIEWPLSNNRQLCINSELSTVYKSKLCYIKTPNLS